MSLPLEGCLDSTCFGATNRRLLNFRTPSVSPNWGPFALKAPAKKLDFGTYSTPKDIGMLQGPYLKLGLGLSRKQLARIKTKCTGLGLYLSLSPRSHIVPSSNQKAILLPTSTRLVIQCLVELRTRTTCKSSSRSPFLNIPQVCGSRYQLWHSWIHVTAFSKEQRRFRIRKNNFIHSLVSWTALAFWILEVIIQ